VSGERVDAVMASEDVMPTLLSLCGVEIPKSVEGLDYAPYMRGGENPNRQNAALVSCVSPFSEYNRLLGGKEYRGIRTERYTYVRDLKGPGCSTTTRRTRFKMTNLVGVASATDLQTKLDAVLNEKLKAAGDEFKPADFYLRSGDTKTASIRSARCRMTR